MKKVLYIATTADSRNRIDGETIKCRLLKEYFCGLSNIQLISVDTDHWQKHIFKLIFLILVNYFQCDDIIVSSADRGAHIVLNFFRKIRTKKKIYYFVIGGSLSRNIQQKQWNVKDYQALKCIYVEAETLKQDLNELNIHNVEVLNNFRKIEPYHNKYQKSKKTRFVYFGRVIKEKGVEEAISLVERLNHENIECSLDIYGQVKEDYLNEIKKAFHQNIRYHGVINPNGKDEYEILSQYDIFIFPTEYKGECLPGALIDAYIAGLAVLASNWKYAHEYILDNQNGKIFEYQNYEDMYKKAKELIREGHLQEYKLESLKLSKKYDIDELLKDFKRELTEE